MTNSLTTDNVHQIINCLNIRQIPVDVHQIAQEHGIEVKYGELGKNISGVIFFEGNRATIGLNESEGKQRQRFTLAHELAHFFLHRDQALHVDSEEMLFRKSEGALDPRETVANIFAAELLMPRAFLKKETINITGDIKKLALKYNVSDQAMTYRLVNLGLLSMF